MPYRIAKLIVFILVVVLIGFEAILNFSEGYVLLEEAERSISFKPEKGRQLIFNTTIYEDGIAHIEINELNPKLDEIKLIEYAFRNILAMNGVRYIYKRNFYWRTWREVTDSKGNTSLVCFRCQDIINVTCLKCDCGHWVIEETPPCLLEIFSVINRTNICVALYNQLKHVNMSCPSIISFAELGDCDNPMESRWRVSRQNDAYDVSERYINVICKKRENCEFLTIYAIFPDRVTFKIINSSNYIIYSRIMLDFNRNYACVGNCGVLKLPSFGKNKLLGWKPSTYSQLENKTNSFFHYNNTKATTKNTAKLIKVYANMTKPLCLEKVPTNTHTYEDTATTSILHCQQLQNINSQEEYYNESEYKDY